MGVFGCMCIICISCCWLVVSDCIGGFIVSLVVGLSVFLLLCCV